MNSTTFVPPPTRSAPTSGSAAEVQSASDVHVRTQPAQESGESAVSWASILCGAAVAAAVSLLLVALGAGLGLASVSPWAAIGVSATTFTAITAIWFVVTQWVASGIGGYLTGRLRTKWVGVHTHEVFFRDTAHGFATWAVATLVVAGALSAGVGSLVAGGAAGVAANPSVAGSTVAGSGYDVDVLLRGYQDGSQADLRAEAMRILANGLASSQGVGTEDRTYLAKQIAAKAGVSQSEAERRVIAFINNAKAAADKAREAAAATALFAGISMLIGAFIACAAAALGGRRRDAQPVPTA